MFFKLIKNEDMYLHTCNIKQSTMDWPQTYFEIIYKVIREQNKVFLTEISAREHLSINELLSDHLPSKKSLKVFLTHTRDSDCNK
jgi:hypothetical protein